MKRFLPSVIRIVILLVAGALFAPADAALTVYPISGRWTAAPSNGSADCKSPFMEFKGNLRFDFGTSSVPEYKALSIIPVDQSSFRIVERFFNGQMEGQIRYTLRLIDADHATMHLQANGRLIALKRCS